MATSRKRSRSIPEENRAECAFTISYTTASTRSDQGPKNKKRKGQDEEKRSMLQMSPFTPTGKFKSISNLDLHYTVEPRKRWLDMTRYNSFVREYTGSSPWTKQLTETRQSTEPNITARDSSLSPTSQQSSNKANLPQVRLTPVPLRKRTRIGLRASSKFEPLMSITYTRASIGCIRPMSSLLAQSMAERPSRVDNLITAIMNSLPLIIVSRGEQWPECASSNILCSGRDQRCQCHIAC